MDNSSLETLARLPLLLNSSLSLKRVLEVAIEHAKGSLGASAATVFLLDESRTALTFWAASGEKKAELQDQSMPAGKGVVGAVISSQVAEVVNDPASDERFFGDVDKKSNFSTQNILCAPLTFGGSEKIGAIQLLNKEGGFTEEDLEFAIGFSHQLAVAISNARLHEALQERTRKLEALTSRREEMLSVISHEFRTPLSLIQSSVGMLDSSSTDELQKRLYKLLNEGVARLTRLMKQIGNLKTVSSNNYNASIAEIKLKELFDNSVQTVKEGFDTRDLSLEVEVGEEVVKGDITLLTIAVSNLLSNAIRFTEDGGSVKLASSEEQGLCKISVTDSGIGIPANEIKNVFEPFYHVANADFHSSGKYEFMSGGLGLGLSTTKSILDAHKRSIQVKSVAGQGSEFFFYLEKA